LASRITIAALALGLLCLAAAAVFAQTPERVPHINDAGQKDFERVRNAPFHRAFFISEGGGYGAGTNASTPEAALRLGKQNCEKRDTTGTCKLYAFNGYVMWGKELNDIPRFANAPRFGRMIPADYFSIRGARSAKGVVIWSHGMAIGADNTQGRLEGYVNRFDAAGWDVYRFNRVSMAASLGSTEARELVEATAALRQAGYARVVLAGESHGAWMSLAAVAQGAKVDSVIASVPAIHGAPPNREARQDFRALMRDIRARNAPDIAIVITLIANDAFEPGGRSIDVQELLGGTAIPLKFIDRPEGFQGHTGARHSRFNEVYGPCIFSFATRAPTATEDCN
jgi:hypothetical protein